MEWSSTSARNATALNLRELITAGEPHKVLLGGEMCYINALLHYTVVCLAVHWVCDQTIVGFCFFDAALEHSVLYVCVSMSYISFIVSDQIVRHTRFS